MSSGTTSVAEPAAEPELWASSRSSDLPVEVWGRPVSAVGHSSNDDEKNDKGLGHLVKKDGQGSCRRYLSDFRVKIIPCSRVASDQISNSQLLPLVHLPVSASPFHLRGLA